MKKILFVCTGNTCRSPMAMAVFNNYVQKNNIVDIVSDSAGIMSNGNKINDKSAKALAKIDIDFNDYTSKQLTQQMVYDFDKIFVMTKEHKNILNHYFKDKEDIFVLGNGIPDPYGMGQDVYDDCLNSIKNEIEIGFEKGAF